MSEQKPKPNLTETYRGWCDCGSSIEREFHIDVLNQVPNDNKWLKCSCGAINWCEKE